MTNRTVNKIENKKICDKMKVTTNWVKPRNSKVWKPHLFNFQKLIAMIINIHKVFRFTTFLSQKETSSNCQINDVVKFTQLLIDPRRFVFPAPFPIQMWDDPGCCELLKIISRLIFPMCCWMHLCSSISVSVWV